MRKFFYAALLTGVFAVSASLHADPLLSYNNFDIAYQKVDISHFGNSNGLNTEISYSPIQYGFLDLEYSYDGWRHDHVNTLHYGGGGYYPLMPNVHLVGNIGGIYEAWSERQEGTSNINRFYIGPELRVKALDMLEIDGGYTWSDGEGGGESDFNVGALVPFMDNAAVDLEIEFLDSNEATRYIAGVRFSY